MSGWGSGPWGFSPWGLGTGDPLQLLSAVAIKENVVELEFNVPPYFSQTLDVHDASNPRRFQIVALESRGRDDEPARPVIGVKVEVAKVALSFGRILHVTTDRPFSPTPSRYRMVVNQLVTAEGALLDPTKTAYEFLGVYRELRPQSMSAPTPSRDIANPQTYSAQLDPIPQAGDPLFLGVIPIDASGDYAFDDGITQLKKRIFRRLLTKPGSFPANPEYGVGVPSYGKQLAVAGVRQKLASEAQKQIASEPDVAAVSVRVVTDPKNPQFTLFQIRVRPAGSAGNVSFDVPFAPV